MTVHYRKSDKNFDHSTIRIKSPLRKGPFVSMSNPFEVDLFVCHQLNHTGIEKVK